MSSTAPKPPNFVGLTGSIDLGDGDFGVGNYRATAVRDRAEKRGVDCLRIAETGCQQHERTQNADRT